MIGIEVTGDNDKTSRALGKISKLEYILILHHYGSVGVSALAAATPKESGETAASWTYNIEFKGGATKLVFHNTHVNEGVPIAIILQYGHGTGTGGWVEGRDYINPAIQPVFDQIAADIWKQVTNA